jgi:maltose alpha-D-glucosyltransferase/alpha-amylase
MPRLFMALQQEDRHPISEILAQTPDIPASCQWAIFLRNHDELTLEMVTDEERDYMYQAYAMDPRMRINVGIRRRLAPLMENSRPRIELLNGLLLSLPGTPIIYYGDEIGMGDNIYLGDRNGVRTPMQWSADQNAGFSRADPARLYAPVIMDSVYGYQAVNVEAQERSPHSLLNWMRRAITLRQQHRTFGRGTMEMLRPDNRRILAFIRRYEKDDPVLVVANLSRTVQPVALDLASFDGLVPVEMSGQSEMPRIGQAPYFLTLGPYALYWFILRADRAASPARVADTQPAGDQSPILLGVDWSHMVAGSTRGLIERRHLVPFLRRQRWFTRRAADLAHARVVDWATLEGSAEPTFLALIAAGFADGAEDRYVVPFTLVDGPEADAVAHETPNAVITRIAGARKGVVHGRLDAAAALALVDLIERAGELPLARGRARGLRTQAFDRARGADGTSLTATPTSVEQSNSSIRLGDRLILKVVRRLLPGVSPELELGRFLTEHARPGLVPPLAGAIEYDDPDRGVSTLALLHGNVPHQSDGWQHALGATERFFDIALTRDPALGALPPRLNPWSAEIPELARDTVGGYLETATVLGRRTAELHLALGSPAARAELGAGVLDDAQIARLAGDVRADAGRLVEDLEDLPPETRGAALDSARVVLAHPDLLRQAADIAAAGVPRGLQTMRIHGDYHLGQVLHHEEAFTIVDFEGEPTRPIEERRRLNSPMKDVAGMVRSFSYAVAAGLEPRLTVTPRDAERLAIWSRWWRTWTTASFLQAYRAAAGDAAFLPSDADAAERLLRFFLLEKILYEVKYEAAHRPDWIIIPLEALAGLVAALAGGDDPDAAASAAGLT